ncbi:MAG: hypothetical protein Q7J31_18425, partial [Syntrophales bacterium]|nr:hypothetical protein [Syntrophales bacterium]
MIIKEIATAHMRLAMTGCEFFKDFFKSLTIHLRDLIIIKIPFMMSSNFKIGGIEDEDIDTGSERRILTDGG